MPANAKQELRDTSATDPAGPDSEDEIGARVICDRVDRKIQDKLQKQTGSLEKNSETTESNKETRDQIPEVYNKFSKASNIRGFLSRAEAKRWYACK